MNISDLFCAVADIRRARGTSEGRVRNYEEKAKWIIPRYERIAGGLAYDKEALDETVLEFRRDFEAGLIVKSAFKAVRRVAADIEDMADYGSISEWNLPPWGEPRNPLHRPVSDAVKRDRGSVVGLAAAALDLMAAEGYSKSTIARYRGVLFPEVVRYFDDRGMARYSDEALDSYLEHIAAREKEWSPHIYLCLRIAASHIKSMHNSGRLHVRTFDGARRRAESGPFAEVLREYEEWAPCEGGLVEHTARNYSSFVALFMEALRGMGVEELSMITRSDVRAARRAVAAGREPNYVCTILSALRHFAGFVEQRYPQSPAFGDWIGAGPRKTRKVPIEGYSRSEADEIISSVNIALKTGARDRAMMTLAKNTGMRGVDIRKLKFSNIDWRANSITVAQSKTGKDLVLPLDSETGTALGEYILGPRAEQEGGDLVFLTSVGRVGPVSRPRLASIVKRHAQPVVGSDYAGLHGPHAFRRGLGKSMVESGVPLDMVAEVLGHSSPASADPYVAVATERLRICADGLDAVPAERIWWLR